jgi:hypothetical protein
MREPTYTPPSREDAQQLFMHTIDKIERLENFFEVIRQFVDKDRALSRLSIEGLHLCDTTIEELRKAYLSMGLDRELIEGIENE